MAGNAEWGKPPWVKPVIIAAPKIRQVYWCEFWEDARLPEMWKTRPVLVVSYKNLLNGPCTIIPLSTEPQDQNPWAVRFDIDGQTCWAVCNQPSTVSPSRFSQFRGKIPLVSPVTFNQVLEKLMKWLPVPFVIEK